MVFCAVAASPSAVRRLSIDDAYLTAAAVDSAEPNTTFSQACPTISPDISSMQAIAGEANMGADTDLVSVATLRAEGSRPRTADATATPIDTSVMSVSAPFATDRSARSIVISTI